MSDQTSTIPKGWKMTTLGEVAEKIGDGLHGTPEYSTHGEYYFVNGNNIENGRMNPTLYGELVESMSTLEKIANALGISSSELLK